MRIALLLSLFALAACQKESSMPQPESAPTESVPTESAPTESATENVTPTTKEAVTPEVPDPVTEAKAAPRATTATATFALG